LFANQVDNNAERSSVNFVQNKVDSHQARCLRCGRILTAAASIAANYGPICRARIRAAALTAALAEFTAAQVAKARELLADGGLVPSTRAGVYRSVDSDGVTVYLTHWAACSCAAGRHERPCYHRAAVRILGATMKAA
jgi:Family of unknown function (DUF6011)